MLIASFGTFLTDLPRNQSLQMNPNTYMYLHVHVAIATTGYFMSHAMMLACTIGLVPRFYCDKTCECG